MKKLEVIILNNNNQSIVSKLYDWLISFGSPLLEDSPPEVYNSKTEQIIIKDSTSNKLLVKLDININQFAFNEAYKKCLAGYFDNVPKDQIGTYTGGNTSLDSSWIQIPMPFDLPDFGVNSILDKLFDALGLGKLSWIPYAAGATICSIKATTSKSLVSQSLFGAASVYLGYSAYKKFKS